MAEETSAKEMVWNKSTEKWNCWNCGHEDFHQQVMAENFVTLSSGDSTTLIEADDFVESWEVTGRGAITCDNCGMEAEMPATVSTVEQCEWEGEEGNDSSFDASFKW